MEKEVILAESLYSAEEKKQLQELIDAGYYSEIITKLLFQRGVRTPESMKMTMMGTIKHQHDASLLPDIEKFGDIIISELKNNGHIVNYTDYDDDGCQSAVIWHRGITTIAKLLNSKAKFNYYANNRFVEGFGVTINGVKDLISRYPDVTCIITTDNGVMAFEGVEYAKSLGIKVIITDHHEPLIENDVMTLPKADAIVNPKRKDSTYPFTGLCGGGVIYKCLRYLTHKLNLPPVYIDELLDFVAMATVGDLVPLIDENRIFVKTGLEMVESEEHLIFEILREENEDFNLSQNKKYKHTVNADLFGYKYCPMVNALSRMTGDIMKAIDIFISEDEDFIRNGVRELIKNNEERKEHTKEQSERGEYLLQTSDFPEVIVLWDDSFEEGIVGLIAGEMCNKYNHPAIVFAPHKDLFKGSARSIAGFPLNEVLMETQDVLTTFGGHEQAAGLSVEKSRIKEFFRKMQEQSKKRLKPEDFKKKIQVDIVLSPSEITLDLCRELKTLEPFGMDFHKPVFGLKEFFPTSLSIAKPYIGDGNTVKLVDRMTDLSVLMFRNPQQVDNIANKNNPKPIGYPEINVWNKTTYVNGKQKITPVITPQFIVTDDWLF